MLHIAVLQLKVEHAECQLNIHAAFSLRKKDGRLFPLHYHTGSPLIIITWRNFRIIKQLGIVSNINMKDMISL